ncbi:hypothetical protein LPJ78_001990 [Coemansia sp. RSA 989]|nr:ClpP/crotonase-like domain-containing protein [Coemansia mojavensis]KAJ1743874.1 hypothetical protein LPJ68_000547 [Coemansia sp. RSA 1086]KAJ1752403.1 hypothetical protein LPJ79_001265 [Coemansia sp. RSA 1821]KAJ1866260.1 hypothetical protein LPJ78_001990 [Coemansia sp. RSA 989]KAJ1874404.1 hypothetical protein LPJ55_001523 [Coemansia sp. RSA 990]KAJ2672852.1 hypothetical protein IWW42_002625 [Coemansia sp. RSA 1085]
MPSVSLPKLSLIKLELFENGVLVMAFNRPKHMNSMLPESYCEWKRVMEFVHASVGDIRVLVVTGSGKAYSAGQDLSGAKIPAGQDEKQVMWQRRNDTCDLTKLLITSPVPIIGAINGPAIGYGCTTLALFDLLVSVDTAVFRTPFAELAFCPEGCSSVTFPRILGPAIANDMLLFGKTMSAKEMHQRGFIARLTQPDELMPVTMKLANTLASRSAVAIRESRVLIRNQEFMDELLRVNEREMDELYRRMISEDAKQAIARVFASLQAKRTSTKPKI